MNVFITKFGGNLGELVRSCKHMKNHATKSVIFQINQGA
jgi:hypothetical protein